jgi:RluA family pseudouridine synthase
MKRFKFKIAASEDGMRLDQYLAQAGLEISKRKIRQVIDVGGVYQNRKRVRVASRTVRSGDVVEVEFDLERISKLRANNFEIADRDILFEDEGLIVINKPPGLPTQATRDQSVLHVETCLRSWLKKQAGKSMPSRLILVHRLDKETSGALIVAKNETVATWLTEQFRERDVGKTYEAICYGVPAEKKFLQRCYLSPIDKRTGQVSPVNSGGKSSETGFELIQFSEKLRLSLIRCSPKTGRSHQIRVHLDMLGYSIVGDKRYYKGRKPLADELATLAAEHHFLHAAEIAFSPAPGKETIVVTASRPANFQAFLGTVFSPSK